MVNINLTKELIDFGKELTKALDDSKLDIRAALWFYHAEMEYWRLVFASPLIKKDGPSKAYKKVQSAFNKLKKKPDFIGLSDIAVVELEHPLIAILNVAINTGPGLSGIRFKNNTINGTVIDDAYIYRVINIVSIKKTDPCPCGSGKKHKDCHAIK